MKINKTKIGECILIFSVLSVIVGYNYFSMGKSLRTNIKDPDEIRISYSGKVVTIGRSSKYYNDILKLNKSRIVDPLIVAKFNIKDSESFSTINNQIQLLPKYNNGLVSPIDENDLVNLKKHVNMIEYLYNSPQSIQYRFNRLYNDSAEYNVEEEIQYIRILYTVTEGDMDLMIFGNEGSTYNSRGILLKPCSELENKIEEVSIYKNS